MATEDKYREIIRVLLSRGLVTQNQITKALEYQCRLPPGQYLPLTNILVEFEYITEEQLKYYLGRDYEETQDPIGRILVEQNIVTQEELNQAIEVLNSFPRSHVSDVLVDMGYASRNVIHQAISRFQLQQSTRLMPAAECGRADEQSHYFEDAPSDLEADLTEQSLGSEESGLEQAEQVVVHLPLGRFLIAQGYLSEDELCDGLEYQQRLPRVIYKPIGEILVALGYITQEQLNKALIAQPVRPKSPMGERLIKAGLIYEWQLSQALSLQFSLEHAHKKLGTLLVELGYVSREDLETELAEHSPSNDASIKSRGSDSGEAIKPLLAPEENHKPLGQILLEKGFVTQTHLQAALEQQALLASEYKPLGDILVLMGHLSEAQLQIALAEQKGFSREPLGQILVKQGVIEGWQLSHALCLQFEQSVEQRTSLGAVLVRLNYTQQELIEEAVLNYYRERQRD